jgi:hypothetical protein
MTNKMYLQMQLQKAVRRYGENAPATVEIRRQIKEIKQLRLSGEKPQMLQFLARFRKAKHV